MLRDPAAIHVVILCDFAVPTGGSQKVAIESAKALAEAGVRVTFVHAVPGVDAALAQTSVRCVDLGLKDVWDRPIAEAAMTGVWNRAVRRDLGRLLAEETPGHTILHLHQWTRAFSPSVFAAALASHLPLVVTAHDYFLACPNGVYYRFEQHRPCALQPLSIECVKARCDPKSFAHKAIRVARSLATRFALAGASFDLIHVSERGRANLAPLLPHQVVHHRIDNPIEVRRKPPALIGPDARFAYIGRLTREKGAVLAAEAARRANCAISFIGKGPAEADIRAANPEAHMLGWRSRPELEALLAGSVKAILAPSMWYETGPLTVAEGAAFGVGAIASSRCGAAEHVVPGSTGYVVEPDVDELATAMRALDERRTAQTFGHAAYDAFWATPPSARAHATALISLYAEILARSPARPTEEPNQA